MAEVNNSVNLMISCFRPEDTIGKHETRVWIHLFWNDSSYSRQYTQNGILDSRDRDAVWFRLWTFRGERLTMHLETWSVRFMMNEQLIETNYDMEEDEEIDRKRVGMRIKCS